MCSVSLKKHSRESREYEMHTLEKARFYSNRKKTDVRKKNQKITGTLRYNDMSRHKPTSECVLFTVRFFLTQ